jgi:pimeloyl-ACP methyl ester carboxylesterase
MRRFLRRLAIGLLSLVAVLLVGGTLWELLQRRAARREHPPAGTLVDVGGGRMLQLDCRGSGSPTVVLESGLDTQGSLSWAPVHDSIAATTRTCAYSRAGMMWSDPAPGARTLPLIVADLHTALAGAGEKPPLVLVGHSLGGPLSLAYTAAHGADVAGLVMVDASHPDQLERFAKEVSPKLAGPPPLIMLRVLDAMSWTGITRVLLGGSLPPEGSRTPADAHHAAIAPPRIGGALAEMDALSSLVAIPPAERSVGDRPLVVLTASVVPRDQMKQALGLTDAEIDRQGVVWRELHRDMASWSSRGREELVDGASHYIQKDRPQVVIAAVREVVQAVRDARP